MTSLPPPVYTLYRYDNSNISKEMTDVSARQTSKTLLLSLKTWHVNIINCDIYMLDCVLPVILKFTPLLSLISISRASIHFFGCRSNKNIPKQILHGQARSTLRHCYHAASSQLFVWVSISSSLKYGCSRAFRADIRLMGSKVSIFCGERRSKMLRAWLSNRVGWGGW